MSTILKPQEKTKSTENKENKNEEIFEDFKKEVFDREKKNIGKILTVSVLIVLVFGLLGVASYQIFLKPEKVENVKTADEKIEGRPEVKEEPKVEGVKKEETKPAETPPAQTQPPASQPTEISYTVQSGDTWSSIANSNDMTSTELMKYNNAEGEDLQIGQTVKIPKK